MINFLFTRHPGKTGKKADCAVWPALIAGEKVERVRIVMISRLIKFHFGTKNSNHVS
jgi:hypothetical protein